MQKHCTTWQPCKIIPKRGDAPCPYSNRQPPPRRSKTNATIDLSACNGTPRYLASTKPARVAMTLNGRGLSHPPPFLSRMTLRMPFLQERRPPHSSWASSSETPVWMHNTNATADVSPYNGISAILGQHKACAQIAMLMNGRGLSPPPPFGLRSLYTHTSYHLTWHTAPMMHRSHKLATMSSYSGCPLRLFPNEPSQIRLCRTVPRMLAYLATTWRSRQYLLLTIPESKHASTVMYATSNTISGSKNAKIQPSEATWQNSPRTRKCNASTVMCATLATTSCKNDCEHIAPRGNIATFSQKDKIRLALRHIGEHRLAEACHMINCGVPA